MAWGERAAEQWEKDQPSEGVPVLIPRPDGTGNGVLSAGDAELLGSMLYDDYGPTYAEKVLDADERRGD